MLLSKWQMIFCETVTIIYDLGPGIKLLLPHFTLLPWPSNFYFYRAIYFKERTKIYWIQHVRSKKSILVYRVMQREYKSVLECCLMLLNAILCRSLVKQKVKMDHFDLNFYRILQKNVDKSWVFMSAVHHRCINFLRSLRILYHLIYYICFAVRIHKHLRPWY